MTYFPKFLSPEDASLDLQKFVQSRYWHKIPFRVVQAGDRVLVVRITNGTRTITESVVSAYDYNRGTWVNNLGTPVVSIHDVYIFKAGASPDYQSEDSSDLMLGG